jgi:hypothetical protein
MRKHRLGRLPWLLPLTHLLHAAEEYFGDFPGWFNRVAGSSLTPERFLELNALFFLAMVIVVGLALSFRPLLGLLVPLATVILLNAALHLGGTLITGVYSPGSITGVLVWAPLGATLLVKLRKEVSRPTFALGVGAGLVLHALVSLAAIRGGRLL